MFIFLSVYHELIRNLLEHVYQNRIKMRPFPAKDYLNGFFMGKRLFVWPILDEGVIDVGYGHQAALQRNFFACNPRRVTCPIPLFLVRPGENFRVFQKFAF